MEGADLAVRNGWRRLQVGNSGKGEHARGEKQAGGRYAHGDERGGRYAQGDESGGRHAMAKKK